MHSNQKNLSMENIDKKNIFETLETSEKKKKLKKVIRELYEEHLINPNNLAFSKEVIKQTKGYQWFDKLSDEKKEIWSKVVKDYIINKLHKTCISWTRKIKEDIEKKKQGQEAKSANIDADIDNSEFNITVDDFLKDLEHYQIEDFANFTDV